MQRREQFDSSASLGKIGYLQRVIGETGPFQIIATYDLEGTNTVPLTGSGSFYKEWLTTRSRIGRGMRDQGYD
jgi:hypothetical protein